MSAYAFGNNPAKIEKYRAFWRRDSAARPLVGFSLKSWFPKQEFRASRNWGTEGYLTPDMIHPEDFLDDQEALLREGELLDDDILRGASPFQGIGWLCGMLGCRIRLLPSSTMQEKQFLSWEAIQQLRLDQNNPWYQGYMAFADALVRRADGRFPVSHGNLSGPTDLLVTFRGDEQNVLDLVDEPRHAAEAIRHFGELFREITDAVWQRLPVYQGGYFDAQYQLWAPEPIVRIQEDAIALYSPRLYTRAVQPVDRALAGHFGAAFMHLHPVSFFALDGMLDIEALRCLQVNYEVNAGGPPMRAMIPHLQKIQQAGRSLIVRGSFEQDELRMLIDHLDPAGLYLYIMAQTMQEVETLRPVVGL